MGGIQVLVWDERLLLGGDGGDAVWGDEVGTPSEGQTCLV